MIFLQVDPSAEIFADPIRGNVKLYGTEQNFEFIESLVSAVRLVHNCGTVCLRVSHIIITLKL